MHITFSRKKFALVGVSVLFGLGVVVRGSAAISNINTISTLNGHPPVLTSKPSTLLHGAPLVDSTEQQVGTVASVGGVLSGQQTPQSILAGALAEARHICIVVSTDCGLLPTPPATVATYSVAVDGSPIGAVSLANAAAAAEVSSLEQRQIIDWTTAYERGAATAVLHQLLWLQSQQDGRAVSEDDARNYANQQLNMYLNNTSPSRPAIAQGETAQGVFTSASAVAVYRMHLSVNAEMNAIAAQAFGTTYTPTQKDTAILAWFGDVLRSHQVSITGLPPFDLATIVPAVH